MRVGGWGVLIKCRLSRDTVQIKGAVKRGSDRRMSRPSTIQIAKYPRQKRGIIYTVVVYRSLSPPHTCVQSCTHTHALTHFFHTLRPLWGVIAECQRPPRFPAEGPLGRKLRRSFFLRATLVIVDWQAPRQLCLVPRKTLFPAHTLTLCGASWQRLSVLLFVHYKKRTITINIIKFTNKYVLAKQIFHVISGIKKRHFSSICNEL